ncbi:MAG: hypothetical protein Unbinned2301contig1004_62 [Prokaryotic dsDNA virus sp.]|nr:MAG: hypothetical protein Unbinned2301contig1004_62 [Prokaryotic dsDNA virus sp.]
MTYRPQRFAPVLIYLVEVSDGLYCHPSRTGFTAGQTVWADRDLQFSCYQNAKAHAARVKGRVVKLRIRATREAVKSRKPAGSAE